jgi:fused signal recognition particle receptor
MAFFSKLKDRLFKSSSKLDQGLDAIVEDGGEIEDIDEVAGSDEVAETPETTLAPEPIIEAPVPEPEPEPECGGGTVGDFAQRRLSPLHP